MNLMLTTCCVFACEDCFVNQKAVFLPVRKENVYRKWGFPIHVQVTCIENRCFLCTFVWADRFLGNWAYGDRV